MNQKSDPVDAMASLIIANEYQKLLEKYKIIKKKWRKIEEKFKTTKIVGGKLEEEFEAVRERIYSKEHREKLYEFIKKTYFSDDTN